MFDRSTKEAATIIGTYALASGVFAYCAAAFVHPFAGLAVLALTCFGAFWIGPAVARWQHRRGVL